MEKLSKLLRSFLLLFTNEQIADSKEQNNIINSLFHWVKKRNDPIQNTNRIKIGDVYFFYFGLNLLPTMSYRHMGIVISKSSKYLYVLPITGYKSDNNIFKLNIEHVLMKVQNFEFLTKDSVVKLKDVRCIAVNAIDFKTDLVGKIDVNGEFFKLIKRKCFESIFNEYAYELDKLKEQRDLLKK